VAKEWVLNQAMNRWGLNKKNSVGAVSEEIRRCGPRNVDDWRNYYYAGVKPKEYIDELGRKLYLKITEVLQYEISEVTQQDCINYMHEVVIDRTYQGYENEITTVYGILQGELGVRVVPAPDEWDRLYNVDFHVEVGGAHVGLQIKPVSFEQFAESHKWHEMQRATHERFTRDFGGAVFIVYSVGEGKTKKIANPQVIDEVRREIERLSVK
jgi:hypothetical protein